MKVQPLIFKSIPRIGMDSVNQLFRKKCKGLHKENVTFQILIS